MTHILKSEEKEPMNIETKKDAYEHVGWFLKKHAAEGKVFSSLAKIFPKELVKCNKSYALDAAEFDNWVTWIADCPNTDCDGIVECDDVPYKNSLLCESCGAIVNTFSSFPFKE